MAKKAKRAKKQTRRKTPSQSNAARGKGSDVYRFVVAGPLKKALDEAHKRMQSSRKYRRLASADIHEVAREALDRGLLEIEHDLDGEGSMLDD